MKKRWSILAHEYIVSLFPLFMIPTAFKHGVERIIGKSCYIILKIENNAVEYYFQPTNWKKVHIILTEKIRQNPKFLKNIFQQIDKLGTKQIAHTRKFQKNHWSETNNELNDYYQQFVKSNTEIYAYGLVLPLLDFHETTFLSDEISKILQAKNALKYLEVLTTPALETFNKLHEIELWKIFLKIQKDQKLSSIFRKFQTEELINYLKLHQQNIWQKILSHSKKYCWVHYVYEGPAADEAYFIDIIKDFIRRKLDPQKAISNHGKSKKQLVRDQNRIINHIRANKYEQEIIKLAKDTIFYKAYRRELQTHSYYHMEFFLKEIAKRLNLSLKQVRMMLPEEIKKALLNNKINTDVINERMKLVICGQKNKVFCLTAASTRKFLENNIQKEEVVKHISKITGTAAFKGKAQGVVKLINSPDEMIKMENKNILVSGATSPNLMPAIRKASAIITDEGGLTCHAAIVSRELGIPCIIGTKIATRVLADGDLVEVNAEKGIVKILKKKSKNSRI